MALYKYQGTFLLNASTGNQTVSFTPPTTFTPVLVKVWSTVVAADGVAANAKYDFGAAVSTSSRFAFATTGTNGSTSTAQHHQYQVNDKLGVSITTGGAVFTAFDFVSFGSNQFVINVTTASAFQRIWHYEVYGGSDLTNVAIVQFTAKTSDGSQAVNGAGFQPDFAEFFSQNNITAPPDFDAATHVPRYTQGWTDGTSQYAMGGAMTAKSYANSRWMNDAVMGLADSGDAEIQTAAFSSWHSDGVNLSWSDTTGDAGYCYAIFYKGGKYKVGSFTSKSSTSPDGLQTVSGIGFTPRGLSFMGAGHTTAGISSGREKFYYGGASSTTARGAIGCSADESNPSVEYNTHETDHCISAVLDSSVDVSCDLSSIGDSQFVLNWDVAKALLFSYFAIGDTPNSGAITATIGSVTAAGTATFDVPVYTGVAGLTVGRATCAASATFGEGTFTGTVAATIGAIVAETSATFSVPVYDASVAVTIGAAFNGASATFAAGTFTGTAAVTIGAATAAASATLTPSVHTGSIAATIGGATAAASAQQVDPFFTGSAAVTIGAATASAAATTDTPTYTATAAVTVGAATASGSATHTTPTYTGEIAATVGAATGSAEATFEPGTHTGSIAATIGGATAAASAEFTAPEYDGTVSATIGAVTCSADATFTPATPVYTGEAACTVGAATADADATFTPVVRTGSISATVGATTAAASATFDVPMYDATISATIGAVDCDAVATFIGGLVTGDIAVTLGPVEMEATATFAVPVFTGTISSTIGAVTASLSATFVEDIPTEGLRGAELTNVRVYCGGLLSPHIYADAMKRVEVYTGGKTK